MGIDQEERKGNDLSILQLFHKKGDEQFGKELWNIGYTSSDWKEDRDEDEQLSDEDDLLEEADLIKKIN